MPLLDLGFLKYHVFARDRIILPEFHLLRLIARVLLGHVVIPRASGAFEFDEDRRRFGHDARSVVSQLVNEARKIQAPLSVSREERQLRAWLVADDRSSA